MCIIIIISLFSLKVFENWERIVWYLDHIFYTILTAAEVIDVRWSVIVPMLVELLRCYGIWVLQPNNLFYDTLIYVDDYETHWQMDLPSLFSSSSL